MSLQDTPRANRLHIGIYGKRNSGKSSLINALTGHQTAIVSAMAGTTTDPVYKSMEIYGIGPCVLIDTAGFDDEGEIGLLRVNQTQKTVEKADLALIVFDSTELDFSQEKKWIEILKKKKTPVIAVLNKTDLLEEKNGLLKEHLIKTASEHIRKMTGLPPVPVSAAEKEGMEAARAAIIASIPEEYDARDITGRIVKDGDLVLLVMPQDIQAPKGRLILPQVQTLRELLDKKCLVMSTTTDKLEEALKAMSRAPDVIITDSQVFKTVYDKKPAASKLTSFSVLFADYKGDLDSFVKGAAAIDNLTSHSKVLIAEACTHAPLSEDIGREKIPALLRKKAGEPIQIDIVSGTDFPDDLSGYDLIIHCGSCMFNRRYVLSRIEKAAQQGVPITNYGVTIAHLSGILGEIDYK